MTNLLATFVCYTLARLEVIPDKERTGKQAFPVSFPEMLLTDREIFVSPFLIVFFNEERKFCLNSGKTWA